MNLKILESGVGVGNQANRNTGLVLHTDPSIQSIKLGYIKILNRYIFFFDIGKVITTGFLNTRDPVDNSAPFSPQWHCALLSGILELKNSHVAWSWAKCQQLFNSINNSQLSNDQTQHRLHQNRLHSDPPPPPQSSRPVQPKHNQNLITFLN